MPLPVYTGDLVEALEGLDDEHTVFLDPRTGEIETLSSEDEQYLDMVEDDDTPLWLAERIALVREILRGHRWLTLPASLDLDEFGMMGTFVRDMGDELKRQKLKVELGREGPYARFQAGIRKMNLEYLWDDHRKESLREVAAHWMKANRVPFTQDADG